MHEKLEQEISLYFTTPRVQALVEAVKDAYEQALLCYSPDNGWDAQAFGFIVFKFIVHRLEKLTEIVAHGFELRPAGSAFRIGLGPFTIAAYCCGKSANQDINESFPNNEHGAPALVDFNQYCLDLTYDEPVIPRGLVLAHFGNPSNGFEALHLAVPSNKEDSRISEWSYTKLLWQAGGEEPGSTFPDLPPPAPITPPSLSLKVSVEKKAG